MLLVSKKEKEKLVLKLAHEGKITRDIAKEVYMFLKDIDKIIHRVIGDDYDPSEKEKGEEKEKQKRLKTLSPYG